MPTLRRITSTLAVAGLVTVAGWSATAPTASAATTTTITSRVLLVDDGQPMVRAIGDRLTKEGVPVTTLDVTAADRPTITAEFLVRTSSGRLTTGFSGVVLPSEAPPQLSAAELAVLRAFESQFGVREVVAYTWAHPGVGLSYVGADGYTGPVDGLAATVTDAGRDGAFGYLRGPLELDDVAPSVDESWGYLSTPLAADPRGGTFVPLVTATVPGSGGQGSLIGQYSVDGREQLVLTFASNAGQQHWRVLSHGIVTWLTRGVTTAYSRNFFSLHVDDVLLPDARWSTTGDCTIGDDCDPVAHPEDAPGATIRMTPADVVRWRSWEAANGIALDVVYNGSGTAEAQAETGTTDPLTTELLRSPRDFRWINHTYTHPYLGCVKNETTTPWSCATTPTGATRWVSTSTISKEISDNITYARLRGIPIDRAELVTGEHSGLRSLPQMPTDNPNLPTALALNGIRWVASDASRERDPRAAGPATTVPRHPMNIYYNTGTEVEAADEYSWVYGSVADGGSGLCERFPEQTTCIAPLDPQTGFDEYIRPLETRIAYSHIVDNDARPHYVHQSNVTEDRIIYPVVDAALATYRATFAANAPLVNPTMTQAGTQLVDQTAWQRQTGVRTEITGTTLTVTNPTWSTVRVPVTAPTGTRALSHLLGIPVLGPTFGSAYAGQQSAWVSVPALGSRSYRLPGATGFKSPGSWNPPATATPRMARNPAPAGPTTVVVSPGGGLEGFVDGAEPTPAGATGRTTTKH